jgi:cyclohexa-1,5-dienecarbonyl-CoA hydratase
MALEEDVSASLSADGRVLDLEFHREKGNVLSGALMRRIDAALALHRESASLKMVLLHGRGKHFSFGASVEEHEKAEAPAMLQAFHKLCRCVAGYPVPVVAAVSGRCLGGAFELALCTHFVIADRGAVFACPEIKLGVFPPVLAALGPLRLGSAIADELLLTGSELGAERAHTLGFVTALADEGGAAAAARGWYEQKLAPLSAHSLRQGVRAVRGSVVERLGAPLDEAERQYVEELLESHDAGEGIAAFIARREPVWLDR